MSNPFRRPNFLILMIDEERYPPVYETPEIKAWRKKNLLTQELLRDRGLEFKRHYAGATACAPSRGTLFTGQYPSLHGVSQTSGVAKSAFDADIFWLDPNTVPTMGDYFRTAGNFNYGVRLYFVTFFASLTSHTSFYLHFHKRIFSLLIPS